MALIEGIGDEVVQFFAVLLIIIVAFIAWWSTNISERPFVRTVLILERRSTTRRVPADAQTTPVDDTATGDRDTQPVETDSTSEDKTASPNADSASQGDGLQVDVIEEDVAPDTDGFHMTGSDLEITSQADTNQVEPVEAVEVVEPVNTDDNPSILRNRRLVFFENQCGEVQSQNASLKELISQQTEETVTEEVDEEAEQGPVTEGSIRIKLKYLNDDQKLVEGRLREQLGDFKKRHFNIELAGRKLVRLIFNGQVLQQDNKTLENYGLFDNCVVHCLVHQPRTPPPSPNLNRASRTGEAQGAESNPPSSWDLGNILFASLSMLLGLAWYGRYQYAQLYTATTTVALVGLTSIFMVSLIGMYMPDVDGHRT